MPQKISNKIPDSLRNFDSLPDSAHVRLPVCVGLDGTSSATIWRKVAAKQYPAPRKISERVSAWNVGELRQHYAAKAA